MCVSPVASNPTKFHQGKRSRVQRADLSDLCPTFLEGAALWGTNTFHSPPAPSCHPNPCSALFFLRQSRPRAAPLDYMGALLYLYMWLSKDSIRAASWMTRCCRGDAGSIFQLAALVRSLTGTHMAGIDSAQPQ